MKDISIHPINRTQSNADVRDVNTDYVLLWEANDNNAQGWFTIGVGDEYRFILDQENLEREYRVVIYSVA